VPPSDRAEVKVGLHVASIVGWKEGDRIPPIEFFRYAFERVEFVEFGRIDGPNFSKNAALVRLITHQSRIVGDDKKSVSRSSAGFAEVVLVGDYAMICATAF